MAGQSERPAAARRGVELADIFRAHGESYRRNHPLPVSHLKVIQAVERCRTAALGGHLQQCDACGFERPAYNSCRNRHCPKCQSLAKVKWLDKQKSELLPIGYFHLVFTLPHELNALILINKKILLSHLFKAVGETSLTLAELVWADSRFDHGAAHLGSDPVRSFSSPLSGPRWSSVVRSKALESCPSKFSVPG